MLPKNLLLRHLTATSHTSPEISTDCPRLPHSITDFPLNLVAVIVLLAFLLFLAFAAILYSKCRHRLAAASLQLPLNPPGLPKKAIKSLPSFRFGSLRASNDGPSLDCAVCLSQFQDPDVLRFLPICRHAFHIDCVDRWLATCSTCPICRSSVSAVNPARFSVPDSIVLSSDSTTDEVIEVLVERDDDLRSGAGFGGGKLNQHKIVVSDVVLRNRWSDVSCSDLMFLNSDSPVVEGRRSLSDITVAPRENPVDVSGAGVEERVRKIWFPIAKRTVESFGSRGGTDKSGTDFA